MYWYHTLLYETLLKKTDAPKRIYIKYSMQIKGECISVHEGAHFPIYLFGNIELVSEIFRFCSPLLLPLLHVHSIFVIRSSAWKIFQFHVHFWPWSENAHNCGRFDYFLANCALLSFSMSFNDEEKLKLNWLCALLYTKEKNPIEWTRCSNKVKERMLKAMKRERKREKGREKSIS